ncbi:MAG: hypothetical protein HUU37_07115 [Bdellovibrionales bacterium]|nr:hypothetical protein [Bdellovibrionales bacterium]
MDENVPCDLYLHFRGKFAKTLSAGSPVTVELVEKSLRTQWPFVYVKTSDLETWHRFSPLRHSADASTRSESPRPESLYGNKRAEYVSFMKKAVVPRDTKDTRLDFAFRNAPLTIQRVIQNQMLDWYFHQFHEPPDLFHHSARVTFLVALFCTLHPLMDQKNLELLVFASVIHELTGDPAQAANKVVSQATVEFLEKNRHPVPADVLTLVRMQDELVSGKGYPHNLAGESVPLGIRIFSLVHHFEHCRMRQAGTRRTRLEAVRRLMETRKGDFDTKLWPDFWKFVQTQVEILA